MDYDLLKNRKLLLIQSGCLMEMIEEEINNKGKRQPEIVQGWIEKAYKLGIKDAKRGN